MTKSAKYSIGLKVFPNVGILKSLFYSLRPAQWIKNFFVFLPLIFGKKLLDFQLNFKTVIAFCLFSLSASVVYLMNDIIDIEKDRIHPIKGLRPIASGKISIRWATAAFFILGILSIALSFKLSVYFGCIVIVYITLNFLYSIVFQNLIIVNVLCIGVFFLLRIIAGGLVAGVELSRWIVITAVLLALFLGFNKRRQEFRMIKGGVIHSSHLFPKDSLFFIDCIIMSITLSIMVIYALYTLNAKTIMEFGSKNMVFTIPFVYLGIFRYIYLIHNAKLYGDPTHILLSDRILQLSILLWLIVSILVIYW